MVLTVSVNGWTNCTFKHLHRVNWLLNRNH